MPVYIYECPKCGDCVEERRSVEERDTEVPTCTSCDLECIRILGPTAFILKGPGWSNSHEG